MRLQDINETVFQALSPEVQTALIDSAKYTTPEVIGFSLVALMFFYMMGKNL